MCAEAITILRAVPQSCIPFRLSIVSYLRSVLLVQSFDFRPSNQYILVRVVTDVFSVGRGCDVFCIFIINSPTRVQCLLSCDKTVQRGAGTLQNHNSSVEKGRGLHFLLLLSGGRGGRLHTGQVLQRARGALLTVGLVLHLAGCAMGN
jgi:hypothetical protein